MNKYSLILSRNTKIEFVFLRRYQQFKRSTHLRRFGYGCIIIGILFAGLASAPLLLEVQWQASTIAKGATQTIARLSGREERAIGRLPQSEDKADLARARMRAFALVGAVHAATVSNPSVSAPDNQDSLVVAAAVSGDAPKAAVRNTKNRIKIPGIKVDMEVAGGMSEKVLNKGLAWMLPYTSMPDKGGNTVIGCHRYLFTSGARTCFNLDKVKKDDVAVVDWKGMRYHYKVREVKIVKPDEVSVLKATRTPVLTVFTCTPKFTSKLRLVVIADLIKTDIIQ